MYVTVQQRRAALTMAPKSMYLHLHGGMFAQPQSKGERRWHSLARRVCHFTWSYSAASIVLSALFCDHGPTCLHGCFGLV